VLPGLLHAWYIIYSHPDPTYAELQQEDSEQGRVTHYYIQQEPSGAPQGGAAGRARGGYGTVGPAPAQQFPGQQAGTVPPAQYYVSQQRMQAGGSEEAPPTYQESTKGDNKVQRHD